MDCKFTWYNLPNKIKEVIAPYSSQLSKDAKKITWFNLPKTINKVYEELVIIKNYTEVSGTNFIWYNLPEKLKKLCEVINYEPVSLYNFWIESSDWSTGKTPITSEDDFIAFLENEGATNIVVTDFSIVNDGALKCNLFFDNLEQLNIADFKLKKILAIGEVSTILTTIKIGGNQLTEFNPTIALPNSLIELHLNDNQLTEFNPTIALPNNLKELYLNDNQLTEFNPTIALPNSLTTLYLNDNQLTEFNPTVALPNNLIELYLNNNQMATSNYIDSEIWATAQPSFTFRCYINFSDNINSVNGTNLKTILESKNCTVTA